MVLTLDLLKHHHDVNGDFKDDAGPSVVHRLPVAHKTTPAG